jgi:hypothetical protein
MRDLDRRKVDFSPRQARGAAEIISVANSRLLGIRDHAGRIANDAIDSKDFAPAVDKFRDAELIIGGLAGDDRNEAGGEAGEPVAFRGAADWVDATIEPRTDDAVRPRAAAEADDVGLHALQLA